jgi:FMN-dependent NADH-azoreductase
MKLLHVDSSILGAHSVSRTISAAIVTHLQAVVGGLDIQHVDLSTTPLSHLSGAYLAGQSPEATPDDATRADVAAGTAALEAFIAADIVVIGCPMYNFAIPSQLKAWIDRICVAGRTFRYTEAGAEGLMGGKRIIVAISRGGLYGPETPLAFAEHQETYLRAVFGFLGVQNITFIRAEGVAFGPEHRERSIAAALHEAEALAAA